MKFAAHKLLKQLSFTIKDSQTVPLKIRCRAAETKN
jgi:hypothetical protein